MVSNAPVSQLRVFLGLVWHITDSINMVKRHGGCLNPFQCLGNVFWGLNMGPEAFLGSTFWRS